MKDQPFKELSPLEESKKDMYDNIGCFFFIAALALLFATCKWIC